MEWTGRGGRRPGRFARGELGSTQAGDGDRGGRGVDVPAVDLRKEITASEDPLVVGDHPAFGKRGVAHAFTRLARGHPDEALAGRNDLGEVLLVDLREGVIPGGAGG